MNTTLDYYAQNACAFAQDTQHVDFTGFQTLFVSYLKPGSRLLDFGCGAGRDTKAFSELGFRVDAWDACQALCDITYQFSGVKPVCKLFSELNDVELYDGIWACASVLHLEPSALHDVFVKMVRALKTRGIMYISFKYGHGCGIRNGRYFHDMNESDFSDFVSEFSEITVIGMHITQDVRPDRSDERWLNIFLRKT